MLWRSEGNLWESRDQTLVVRLSVEQARQSSQHTWDMFIALMKAFLR